MTRYKRLTESLIDKVVALTKESLTVSEIAYKLEMTPRSVIVALDRRGVPRHRKLTLTYEQRNRAAEMLAAGMKRAEVAERMRVALKAIQTTFPIERKKRTKPLQVHVFEEQMAAFESHSAKAGMTKSELFRRLLADAIVEWEKAA